MKVKWRRLRKGYKTLRPLMVNVKKEIRKVYSLNRVIYNL